MMIAGPGVRRLVVASISSVTRRGVLRRGVLQRTFSTSSSTAFMGGGIVAGLKVSASVIAACNALGFAITATTRTHKVADLLSSGPLLVSAVATYAAGPCTLPGLAMTTLTSVWCYRLTSFLVKRVLEKGKDNRFDSFIPEKGDPLTMQSLAKLVGLWTAMAAWGIAVSLPVTVINSTVGAVAGPVFWIAIAGQSAFFVLETAADMQKAKFKAAKENKDEFMRSGLWKYSQHPHYFGELMFWWCAYGATLAACGPTAPAILSVASPAMTSLILLKGSGLPMSTELSEKKYGHREDYQQYKRDTNLLIPWFPRENS